MKEILGIIAVVLTVVGHAPYIRDILVKKTKPHVFTWIIWAIVTILAFWGQWVKGGGAGSWTTLVTGLITIIIAVLSLNHGSRDITKLDKLMFLGALIAIIPWYLTNDPTLSIIIITLIDFLAFFPTVRKTLKDPTSETFSTYFLNVFRHGISIIALANYNIATALYPATLLIINLAMVLIMLKPKIKT